MLYGRRAKLKILKKLEAAAGRAFSRLPFSPNFYTLLSLPFAFLSSGFMYLKEIPPAALCFFAAIALDFIDGAVARTKRLASKKGAYLDTIADRWVEIILLAGFLFLDLPDLILPFHFWIFLLLAGSLMTTYTKAAAKEKEVVKTELKGGLLERAERVFLLWIALVLAGINPFCSAFLISVLAILAMVSAVQRAFAALKSCKR